MVILFHNTFTVFFFCLIQVTQWNPFLITKQASSSRQTWRHEACTVCTLRICEQVQDLLICISGGKKYICDSRRLLCKGLRLQDDSKKMIFPQTKSKAQRITCEALSPHKLSKPQGKMSLQTERKYNWFTCSITFYTCVWVRAKQCILWQGFLSQELSENIFFLQLFTGTYHGQLLSLKGNFVIESVTIPLCLNSIIKFKYKT